MNWFKDWFNTPYYHILYKNRSDGEAQLFMKNLVERIPLNNKSKLLDLACGKGRHSRYLHTLGFEVTGIDLSDESIEFAQEFAQKGLHFEVADMRNFELNTQFDYIANLFTSFGYFEDNKEDDKVFNQVCKHLNTNGLFIQDYLNSEFVKRSLQEYEEKTIDGILFKISKSIQGNFVVKDINFSHNEKDFHYQEKVKLYDLHDFKNFAKNAGLEIIQTFGNFTLDSYNAHTSPRLINVYKKI